MLGTSDDLTNRAMPSSFEEENGEEEEVDEEHDCFSKILGVRQV